LYFGALLPEVAEEWKNFCAETKNGEHTARRFPKELKLNLLKN